MYPRDGRIAVNNTNKDHFRGLLRARHCDMIFFMLIFTKKL